ncbi:MAG TPA: phosphate ABC transporter substrate-binding protein PstS [Marmoricola sp.]|nr:phosphate ABC transporter substrate-binding protein PstS [Marmoricola sp.]
MNRTSLLSSGRRVAVPGVAALALGLALTGCGAANESPQGSNGKLASSQQLSGTLKGAGSSAQEAAMDAWRADVQRANPDLTVNYDPAGSGAGVQQFNAGATDFAGSDKALDPAAGEVAAAKKRCGADAIEVPDYISPIAIVFNVPGVKSLKLDGPTVAKIFAGKITSWNDPAIAAQNKGVKLPATHISPVHRSDESGTTNNFTDYLHQAGGSAWGWPAGETWPIKSGEGANGTSGVVAAVKAGTGTIGYADASQAGGLSTVSVKVGSSYVGPTAAAAAKTLAVSPVEKGRAPSDIAVSVDRTPTAAGAYPVLLTSYLIACPTYPQGKAEAVKGLLSYIVSSAGQQSAAKNAGSAPLPATLMKKDAAIINTIKAK